jgi:hypothetical protein
MIVKTFGSKGLTTQTWRIERSMYEDFGCRILSDSCKDKPELIFCNDLAYADDALNYAKNFPDVLFIQNVLDIPWHCGERAIENSFNSILSAFHFGAKISVISETVKRDVEENSEAKVSSIIYQPIQDVLNSDGFVSKTYKHLYVGRARDPNKRFDIVKQAFETLEINPKELAVVGSENPFFGDYLGVIPNYHLAYLYENCNFVWLPSLNEGIGLSMIEGLCHGKCPIVIADNKTAKEFWPYSISSIDDIKNLIKDFEKQEKLLTETIETHKKTYKELFSAKSVAQRILEIN